MGLRKSHHVALAQLGRERLRGRARAVPIGTGLVAGGTLLHEVPGNHTAPHAPDTPTVALSMQLPLGPFSVTFTVWGGESELLVDCPTY